MRLTGQVVEAVEQGDVLPNHQVCGAREPETWPKKGGPLCQRHDGFLWLPTGVSPDLQLTPVPFQGCLSMEIGRCMVYFLLRGLWYSGTWTQHLQVPEGRQPTMKQANEMICTANPRFGADSFRSVTF